MQILAKTDHDKVQLHHQQLSLASRLQLEHRQLSMVSRPLWQSTENCLRHWHHTKYNLYLTSMYTAHNTSFITLLQAPKGGGGFLCVLCRLLRGHVCVGNRRPSLWQHHDHWEWAALPHRLRTLSWQLQGEGGREGMIANAPLADNNVGYCCCYDNSTHFWPHLEITLVLHIWSECNVEFVCLTVHTLGYCHRQFLNSLPPTRVH